MPLESQTRVGQSYVTLNTIERKRPKQKRKIYTFNGKCHWFIKPGQVSAGVRARKARNTRTTAKKPAAPENPTKEGKIE